MAQGSLCTLLLVVLFACASARINPLVKRKAVVEPDASMVMPEGHAVKYTKEAQDDHVPELPGVGPVKDFGLFSGYINVDPKNDRNLFYAYTESRRSMDDPLILWLNGGPGCSSIGGGFMSELGPWFPHPDGRGLMENPHAWNDVAHVVFLENLPGVGFSYSGEKDDLTTGDARTARDSLTFLLKFFERFPHLQDNDFYIAGESYAGHYVPQLAYEVHRYNRDVSREEEIQMRGYIVGNPWTATELDNIGAVDYWYGHALISSATSQGLKENCDWTRTDPEAWHPTPKDPSTKTEWCDHFCNKVTDEVGTIDLFDIYAATCTDRSQAYQSVHQMANSLANLPGGLAARVASAGLKKLAARRTQLAASKQGGVLTDQDSNVLKDSTSFTVDPCVNVYVDVYLNLPEVQKALHANQSSEARKALKYEWIGCSSVVRYNQHDQLSSVIPVYRELLDAKKYDILVYSGDVDGIVPVTGTRRWVASLDLPEVRTWRPWVTQEDEQVGGYMVEYEGLTFATVRDAGHMVPYTQPIRMRHLLKSFLRS